VRTLIPLVVLIAGTARAQEQRLPTDNELRASYCITYLQGAIRSGQQYTQSSDQARAAEAVTAIAAVQRDLRKLQQYLVPRIPYLDVPALATASASASDDLTRLPNMTPDETQALTKKLASCRDLSWLPI
jgi:hypothetical protein